MTAHVSKDAVDAAVAQLVRLGIGSSTFQGHVQQVAERHGVTERTVYRWLAARPVNPQEQQDAAAGADDETVLDELIDGHRPAATLSQPSRRTRFEIDTLHLTVFAHCRDAHTTWRLLTQKGLVDVSYPTFMRAFQRTDPARVRGAIDGYPGLVNNRQYLRRTAPHRNHSLHADHTEADVWVIADHRSLTPIRPHLTVTADGYSGLIHAYLWPSRPTGEKVAAALVETAAKHDYHGVTLGGIPEQLIVDNGGENLAGVVTDAARRLGWIISPAPPSLARVRRFINELGLTWGDLLDEPAPGIPTVYLDPTDRQATLARLITTSERAVSLDHLAVVFGVTIADVRADLDTIAGPLAALGFRLVHTESCTVILNRGKDPNADDAATLLAVLRDADADLNVSATRTLYRAYTGSLSTRELANNDRVQVGLLVNRGALRPPAANHRATLTDDTLYCLTID